MGKLINRARMTVASAPGTGVIALGSAVAGNQSFAAAGIADGDVVSYVAESGYSNGVPSVWEYGQGTYAASGTTLTRTTVQGGTSGTSPVTLTADAQVFVSPLAQDLPPAALTGANTVVKRDASGTIVDAVWDLIIEQQQASGNGATGLAAGWGNVVPLNTVVTNSIGVTLSGNVATFPAGTYNIWFEAPGFATGGHQARLYDVTAATVLAYGGSESVGYSAQITTRSSGERPVTLAAPHGLRIDMFVANAAYCALGVDNGSGALVYGRLKAKRIG